MHDWGHDCVWDDTVMGQMGEPGIKERGWGCGAKSSAAVASGERSQAWRRRALSQVLSQSVGRSVIILHGRRAGKGASSPHRTQTVLGNLPAREGKGVASRRGARHAPGGGEAGRGASGRPVCHATLSRLTRRKASGRSAAFCISHTPLVVLVGTQLRRGRAGQGAADRALAHMCLAAARVPAHARQMHGCVRLCAHQVRT